jgi:hypothetical protein
MTKRHLSRISNVFGCEPSAEIGCKPKKKYSFRVLFFLKKDPLQELMMIKQQNPFSL